MHRVYQKEEQEEGAKMDELNAVSTISATAAGGRNGHTQSADGLVGVDLSVPKATAALSCARGMVPARMYVIAGAVCAQRRSWAGTAFSRSPRIGDRSSLPPVSLPRIAVFMPSSPFSVPSHTLVPDAVS